MNDAESNRGQLASVSHQLARKVLSHRKYDRVSGSSGAQLGPSGAQKAADDTSNSFSGNSSASCWCATQKSVFRKCGPVVQKQRREIPHITLLQLSHYLRRSM